jgi:hypothetical protein
MSHFCRYWASITIDAPPDAVWPWLAQIEYGLPSGRPCPAWVTVEEYFAEVTSHAGVDVLAAAQGRYFSRPASD